MTICRLSVSPLSLLRKKNLFLISPASSCRWINYKIGLWSNQTSPKSYLPSLLSLLINHHLSGPSQMQNVSQSLASRGRRAVVAKTIDYFGLQIVSHASWDRRWVYSSVPVFLPQLGYPKHPNQDTETGKMLQLLRKCLQLISKFRKHPTVHSQWYTNVRQAWRPNKGEALQAYYCQHFPAIIFTKLSCWGHQKLWFLIKMPHLRHCREAAF